MAREKFASVTYLTLSVTIPWSFGTFLSYFFQAYNKIWLQFVDQGFFLYLNYNRGHKHIFTIEASVLLKMIRYTCDFVRMIMKTIEIISRGFNDVPNTSVDSRADVCKCMGFTL